MDHLIGRETRINPRLSNGWRKKGFEASTMYTDAYRKDEEAKW